MKIFLGVAAAAVGAWMIHNVLAAEKAAGSVPLSTSQAIMAATGQIAKPAPLGSVQAQSYTGSAPYYQTTGNAQPPASGIQQGVATALQDGAAAVAVVNQTQQLINSLQSSLGSGDDSSAYPSLP